MLEDMNFSIEMETGTGKTYVYLRTILELNKKYCFIKFVIIVPSVAIKEGVLKTLKITMLHFREIYEKIPYSYYEYDSKKINTIMSVFAPSIISSILFLLLF
jgi:type III restriction enzyme